MTLPLPSSRSTLKARISPSRPSRSSSLVFRFQMRLDRAWSSWNLEMGHVRNTGRKWMLLKSRFYFVYSFNYFLLVIKKLPVDFNLYPLPPLPQDDRFLVWILKTNARPSNMTTSSCLFAAANGIKAVMSTKWQWIYPNKSTRTESKAVGSMTMNECNKDS